MVTLIKNGKRQEFSERAAKIAVESFGWQEMIPLKVPSEIGTKTRPPEIKRTIEPAILKLVEEKKEPVKEAVKEPEKIKEPEKTRKSPVRSKTTKK